LLKLELLEMSMCASPMVIPISNATKMFSHSLLWTKDNLSSEIHPIPLAQQFTTWDLRLFFHISFVTSFYSEH
jgi:hypothetical protein